jgi:hypothetical protein
VQPCVSAGASPVTARRSVDRSSTSQRLRSSRRAHTLHFASAGGVPAPRHAAHGSRRPRRCRRRPRHVAALGRVADRRAASRRPPPRSMPSRSPDPVERRQ